MPSISLENLIDILFNRASLGEIDVLSAIKLQDLIRNILTKYSALDIIVAQILSLSPNSTVVSIDQLKVNIIDDNKSFLQSHDNFLVFYGSNSVYILYKYQGYVFILTIQSQGIILQTTIEQLSEMLHLSTSTDGFISKFHDFKIIKLVDKPIGISTSDYSYLCIKELINL